MPGLYLIQHPAAWSFALFHFFLCFCLHCFSIRDIFYLYFLTVEPDISLLEVKNIEITTVTEGVILAAFDLKPADFHRLCQKEGCDITKKKCHAVFLILRLHNQPEILYFPPLLIIVIAIKIQRMNFTQAAPAIKLRLEPQ